MKLNRATILLFFLVIIGLFAWPFYAQANTDCIPAKLAKTTLETKTDKQRTGIGFIGDQAIMELWRSESGPWSLVQITPDGMACLVAAGHEWEPLTVVFGDPT